ncbi:TIGR03086 family metal-binding protein [Cryptosporangium arvum]|uniref:TIGR03086 family protein n=1 Tax=Cryptosporangium arvum DSM 44712 TaxID=927661 RepID=A0A010ZU00_9ACTN|nr:TIGR03086 family metal-binding protein [Cryptosporangium arvum]EXG80682.1 TIGR03086 family protein [Cryptosporangium arvum DSM 44712]
MVTDLRPATDILAGLVRDVRDDQLGERTPSGGIPIAELLVHLDSLAGAFTDAATKTGLGTSGPPPAPDSSQLGDDWRDRIPARLVALGDAWAAPEAWTGATRAGGLDLPGDQAGAVALNEVLVHGWDLAVALGRRYPGDDPALADAVGSAYAWVSATVEGSPDGIPGLFGPRVRVAADAPPFDQLVAATGRLPR